MGPQEKRTLVIVFAILVIGSMIVYGIFTSYVPLLKQYGNPLQGFDPKSIDSQMKNFQSPLKVFNGTP